MKPDPEIYSMVVYAGTLWQAGMVKTLLADSEIESYLQDEIIGTLNPWWTAPGGAGAIKVFVSSSNYAKARAIVEAYENNASHTE